MSKKNSNVLNLKKNFKSNKKILEMYSMFKTRVHKLKNQPTAVAVSGGPDSLALSAMSKALEYDKWKKFKFILVDHGIRKNSNKEALQVKKLLSKFNISLIILINKKPIVKNIQSKAREIRYNLLKEFCKKKKIKYILTAHHREDQIETFLIRLSRGSGVQGLSSMREISRIDKNIKLFRPTLDFKKKDLVYLTKKIFGKFFIDPSNKNSKYLRTKIRKLIVELEKSGIKKEQIVKSIKNLGSSSDTISLYVKNLYRNLVTKRKKAINIDYLKFSTENIEIQLSILSNAIKNFTKSYYPQRSKKIINVLKLLNSGKHAKLTLGGCIIEKSKKVIYITKEH
jgi:tRNA(Ile)-lysidine synthase